MVGRACKMKLLQSSFRSSSNALVCNWTCRPAEDVFESSLFLPRLHNEWYGAWNSRSTSSWFFWSSLAPMNPNESNWPWDKSPVILESGPPVPPLLWWTTDAGMPPCRTRWPWGEEMGTSIRTLDGDETSFSGCHRCYPGYWRDKIRWLIIGVRSSVKSWEKRDLFFSTTSPGSFFGSNFSWNVTDLNIFGFSQSHLQSTDIQKPAPNKNPRQRFREVVVFGSACQCLYVNKLQNILGCFQPYFLMDDLGGKPTIFGKHPYINV